MTRPTKRNQLNKEIARERERKRKIRKIQEERGWVSSEEEEDVVAIGLLQGNHDADLSSDESEDDEVLVSEGEELEEVDESAFEKLMASVQPHIIDQAVILRVAAALAEFLKQSGTSRIRKVACKRRWRHWATECFFILSFTVSLILLSATGAEQNGLQEKTVGSTLKDSRQQYLKH